MEGKLKSAVLSFFVLGIFSPLFSSLVFAQTPAGGPSLTLAPIYFDEDMKGGDTKTESIYVTNGTNQQANVISEVADFYYDEKGDVQFIEENDANPSTSSMKKWMSYPTKEFTLAPNEQKQVTFTITVPQNAEPGGHYGVMFFRTKPVGSGTVAISARVGAMVMVTIPGDVRKTAELSDFKVGSIDEKNNLIEKSFFENGPIGFSFKLKNTGNAHFKPQGNITIKDMFGNTVADIKPQDARAFPGTPRVFIQKANLNPLGSYTATLNIKDGDGKQLPLMTVSFWGLNYKLFLSWLLVIIIVLTVLIAGIKQYNKWIIAQAHKHHKK